MPVKIRSFTKRFDDRQRDLLGALLFNVSDLSVEERTEDLEEDVVLTRWEGLSPNLRRIYRHRAMEFGREFWREQKLDEILKRLAPEKPIESYDGNCVWCDRAGGRMVENHADNCPWVMARLLLGDELE